MKADLFDLSQMMVKVKIGSNVLPEPLMKIILILLYLFVGSAVFCPLSLGGGDRSVYNLAVRSAKSGHQDFAFMYYRCLLRDYPNSRYVEQALFAQGEYYFSIPDYPQAASIFNNYVKRYPDSKARLFALAYLLKIARIQGQGAVAKRLEKDIITCKQVGLVFSDRKQYSYVTPLYEKFKAVFRIDTIEFYVERELFEKITY